MSRKVKPIAFYLPQFHRTPENDLWWGEGFTEWTNTRAAKPLFRNHYQPRKPMNNYYYDLTDPSAREFQANLAKSHGIYGFCYYHYWFNGKLLLEKPFEAVLHSGTPTLPFCLCWANEPWTRTWTGEEREVLMPQTYGGLADWEAHFEYLLPAFRDKRYIRDPEGRPVFLIYRPGSIEDCEKMIALWQKLAVKHGLPGLHMVEMLTSFENAHQPGFQAAVEFEPMFTLSHHMPLYEKLKRKLRAKIRSRFFNSGLCPAMFLDKVSYDTIWKTVLNRRPTNRFGQKIYPGGFVGWDNTPRRGSKGLIVHGSNPHKFRSYIKAQMERSDKVYDSEFIFINAWNEWAEGTYLEPDSKFGTEYLNAFRASKP